MIATYITLLIKKTPHPFHFHDFFWQFLLKLNVSIFQVHIEFTGDVIKIEGTPKEADAAHEILDTEVKELLSKMDFVEINVDAKYHKHIIGKGGSTGM